MVCLLLLKRWNLTLNPTSVPRVSLAQVLVLTAFLTWACMVYFRCRYSKLWLNDQSLTMTPVALWAIVRLSKSDAEAPMIAPCGQNIQTKTDVCLHVPGKPQTITQDHSHQEKISVATAQMRGREVRSAFLLVAMPDCNSQPQKSIQNSMVLGCSWDVLG